MLSKKICSLVIIFVMLFVTGCTSDYDDATTVAIQMLDYLIEENYSEAVKLVNYQGDLISNEKNFEEYVNALKFDFTQVEEYTVIVNEEEEEIIDAKIVEINLGNNKILELNMQNIDNDWYVMFSKSDIKTDLEIIVGENSVVKIDGVILDREKYSEVLETKLSNSYGTELVLYKKADVYTIPFILNGSYELVVENDVLNNLNQEIYTDISKFNSVFTDKSEYFESSNYKYELIKNYSESEIELMENLFTNYFDAFNKAVSNNSEFTTLTSYYNTNNVDMLKQANQDYLDFIDAKISVSSGITRTNVDFEYSLNGFDEVNYISDNIVIVKINANICYTNKQSYSGTMSYFLEKYPTEEDKQKLLNTYVTIIKEEGKYLIHGQTSLYPYLSVY